MPTTEAATYTVFDEDYTITLTPEFDQQPPCGYTAGMTFTWTIPSLAPIYKTADPYGLMVTTTNIDFDGTYTVFLENHIVYGEQTWHETVSYDIEIVNPCESTELFTANTTFADMYYEIAGTQTTQSFTAVTDTVTNGVTTGGSCGEIVYTLATNDTAIGVGMLEFSELLNARGLSVYTEDEEYIGYYTIFVIATLSSYP